MFAYLILFRYLCTCNYSYMIGANYDIYMIVNFLTIITIVVSGCYMLNKESKLLHACNDLIYYCIDYQGITPPRLLGKTTTCSYSIHTKYSKPLHCSSGLSSISVSIFTSFILLS